MYSFSLKKKIPMHLCGGKNLSVTDRKSLGSSMQKMILATTFCNIGSLVLANILRDSFNILCSISSSQVCKRGLEAHVYIWKWNMLSWFPRFESSENTSLQLDPLIRSLRLLLKDLTKPHTKVKSGDLSIMHDNNVMPRGKLSSDWLKTNVTEKGLC